MTHSIDVFSKATDLTDSLQDKMSLTAHPTIGFTWHTVALNRSLALVKAYSDVFQGSLSLVAIKELSDVYLFNFCLIRSLKSVPELQKRTGKLEILLLQRFIRQMDWMVPSGTY